MPSSRPPLSAEKTTKVVLKRPVLREGMSFTREGGVFTREDGVFTREDGVLTREDGVLTREDGVFTREDGVFTREVTHLRSAAVMFPIPESMQCAMPS